MVLVPGSPGVVVVDEPPGWVVVDAGGTVVDVDDVDDGGGAVVVVLGGTDDEDDGGGPAAPAGAAEANRSRAAVPMVRVRRMSRLRGFRRPSPRPGPTEAGEWYPGGALTEQPDRYLRARWNG